LGRGKIGFQGLRDWRPVGSLMFRPATGPSVAALKQQKARRQFDGAWAIFIDSERAVLASVVLGNRSIAVTAVSLELSKETATQRLVEALDRLAGHWNIRGDGPDRRSGHLRGGTFRHRFCQ
jgi:hypothetical protein